MSPVKRLLLILALTAMWSPSFLFIKLAINELPPMTIVALRVSFAALVMGLILLWRRQSLPRNPAFWIHSAILAFFSSIFPFCLFCYAEQTIESALAAVINGISPIFTAILAHLFLPSDRLHPQKLLGIGLSCAGLFFLFAPNLQEGVSGTMLGMGAALTASISYSVSHVYAKKFQSGQFPFVVPAAQLICSTLLLAPVAFFVDHPFSLPIPSYQAMLGVCCLSLFGTIFAFIIYYKLLDHCGPTAISMVACFFPVIGMLLGFAFLGESLSWGGIASSALIFLGLVVVNEVLDLHHLFNKLKGIRQAAAPKP